MGDTTKERLGDYELLELIGDGAQGKVFKARRVAGAPSADSEYFAVKVLRFSGDDEKKIGRFKQSATTLERLGHRSIVRYFGSYTYHSGEWDEAHCLVMEYLDGDSLDDLLKKSTRGLPWPEVMKIFDSCLEGLIYAKQQGIIHRDIKPSNIFIIRSTGVVKLIDFDIARREDESQNSTAGWKGTFDYMAPDFVVVPGFRGDEQSDIFSLGVCLFQAMTGSLPFDALGEGAHIGYLNRWRDPAAVKPTVEAGIFRVLLNARQVVMNSLHPVRESRYKTFQEMLDALRTVQFRTLEHKGRETYELHDWLGRGGFGEVYKGMRRSDGAAVAVKRLFAAEYSDRFIKEARILQKYPHPALVRYVDFVEVAVMGGEKQYFLVLDYLEGMPQYSLRNQLRDGRRLPVREAVGLFIQYLSALQFLHENPKPIIHRDIKPSNLYAPPGHPENGRIFDMGVARDVAGTATSGGIPGTLDYMAPEFSKAGSERGSPQSDLFSLGLCLYEALTGTGVFEKLPPEMSTAWVKFQERSRPPITVDTSQEIFQRFPALAPIVQKSLVHDPKLRYASAAQMKRDLEAVLPSLPEEVIAPASADITMPTAAPATGETGYQDAASAVPQPTGATAGSAIGPAPGESVVIDWNAKRKKDVRRNRVLGALVVVAGIACAGAGFKFLPPLLQQWKEQRAAEVQPAPTKAPVSDLIAEKFRTPAASSAYVSSLGAEVAGMRDRINKGLLHGDDAKQALAALEQQGSDMPAVFESAVDAALKRKDAALARALIDDWKKTQPSAELLNLTIAQHEARARQMDTALGSFQMNEALAAIRGAIPADPAADGAWAQAEDVAAKLAAAGARSWPGVTDEDRNARVAAVAASLKPALAAGLSGATATGEVAALKAKAPRLTELFSADYEKRRQEIEGSAKGREQFQADINALVAAVPTEASSTADLGRAEDVATKLKDFPKRNWAGVSDAEKLEAASRVKDTLLPTMGATVAGMRSAALLRSRVGQTAESAKDPLLQLELRYPNATALVSSQYKKALADVDAAWKSRPPPDVSAGTTRPAATPPPAVPTAPAPAVPAAPPEDPNEGAVIKTLLGGGTTFLPEGETAVNTEQVAELLAAAAPVRKGFNVIDLFMSPKSGQDFLAAVDQFWNSAAVFTGPFGDHVRDAAWQIIHAQLAKAAEVTLKGQIASRPPMQQGKVRREFLKLLTRIDEITGRVSTCTEQDILRARVSLYFEEMFYNDSLLDVKVGGDDVLEQKIPWLKDKFDKIRVKRVIKGPAT